MANPEPPFPERKTCVNGHTWTRKTTRLSGPSWCCRKCAAENTRRWRIKTGNPRNTENQRNWRARNREKLSAQLKVYRAVKAGRLVRLDRCEHYGGTDNIQASHTDYAKPLDVEWLCPMCHAAKDAAIRRQALE